MSLTIFLFLAYVLAGPVLVKRSLASAEAHYLRLAKESGRPQTHMDSSDWVGAVVLFALPALVFTPLLLGWLLVRPLVTRAAVPVRSYFLPPAQKAHEVHVGQLDAQKDLVLQTAEQINEVAGWKPDDAGKQQMLAQLQEVLNNQLEALAKLGNPNSMFDKQYMGVARQQIEDTRRGLKELTA